MSKKTKKIAENDAYTKFVPVGKTKNLGLNAYRNRGKVYIDVTPLLMDMGKGYERADELRLLPNGLDNLSADDL